MPHNHEISLFYIGLVKSPNIFPFKPILIIFAKRVVEKIENKPPRTTIIISLVVFYFFIPPKDSDLEAVDIFLFLNIL